MRASAKPTRERVKAGTKGRPVATSFGGAATGFLTLPTVSKLIPVTSVSKTDDGEWLETAELCAELVGDNDLVINNKTSARDIIAQSLSVWASRLCADIKWLDSFELIAALDRDAFGLDYCEEKKEGEKKLFIGFQSHQSTKYITVKTKVEMLEKQHPGLGHTAIHYVEMAGYRTFEAFTPQVGLHHASYLYWYGMDNDDDFKEELEGCGDEEVTEETLFPSQYLAAFPDFFLSGQVLERDALQNIATGNDEASATAKAILSIMDLIDQDAKVQLSLEYYGENAYFSCYMGTGEDNDMLGRVLDDFYRATSNGGEYTDIYGIAEINFDKKTFLNWKVEMEKAFSLYTQLDRLVQCIGDIQ